MTCYANNKGVEELLRGVVRELQEMNSKLTPLPPPPLPPPATKDFVAGVPDEFLVERYDGQQYKYTKNPSGGWDVLRRLGAGFVFHDNVGHESARKALESTHRVWVRYKK